ncbi:polysaccharide biosynthesis/export family protein [Rhodoblastus sp.]|uniref:polysaccharide biosynthesis/export family protein n=1 Tax=Rhodoblastus sp. TaxID=1962975 RepID=UPI003F9A3F56
MTTHLSPLRRRIGLALLAACAAPILFFAAGGRDIFATTSARQIVPAPITPTGETGFVNDDTLRTTARPIIPAPITPSGETGFVNGDTLKLTFYETTGSSDAHSSRPALSMLVEDAEMTGEYVVQLDGTIYVPLIGTVKAAGLTPEGLQGELGAKSGPLFSHPVKMIIKLVKREPIYVTGSVPQAGVFDYRPYMTVLHAMILAGVRSAGPQTADRMDVLQATEHLRKTDAALAGLIAKREALVARRDGGAPTPSATLVALVGKHAAERRFAEANQLVILEDAKQKGETAAFDEGLAAIENERKILKKSLEDAQSALEQAAQRYEFVTNNKTRGLIVQNTVDQTQVSLELARAHLNDLLASMARLEESAITLRQRKTAEFAEAAIARQREIDNLQDSITEAAITRATFGPTLDFANATFVRGTGRPTVRILRSTAEGMTTIQATEITPVLPGDIVEVTKPAPSFSSAASATEPQDKRGSDIPEAPIIEGQASREGQ